MKQSLAALVIGFTTMSISTPVSVQSASVGHIVPTLAGYATYRLHAGESIRVTVMLPTGQKSLCVGLASYYDRSGLPVNLGRLRRVSGAMAPVLYTASVTVPTTLLNSEPAGAFMLFAGQCESVTVDTPAFAATTLSIE